MNDLDLIKEFRSDLPPADPATLARARNRMFREAAAPRSPRRLAWGLAPLGALACAVVVGAVALRPNDAVDPPSAVGPAGPAGVAEAPSDPAGVLRLAAAEARKEPVLPARPDQFVYIKSLVAWASVEPREDGGKDLKYVPAVESERQIWLAVDGKLPGLLRVKDPADPDFTGPAPTAAPVKGKVPPDKAAGIPLDANVPPAYRTDLPTDPKAMRAYLFEGTANDPKGRPAERLAWTKVGDLLREQYLPPASVAALFDAAATIKGTSTVKQVDLAGRKGIAVSRTDSGTRHDLIFDSGTYRFLGERDVVVGEVPGYPKGAVTGWTAQLRIAIVDKAGQRP